MIALKNALKNRLKSELPGFEAHQEAAPYRKVDYDGLDVNTVRKSGVLILLYERQSSPHFTLIKRPDYGGIHGGQIALPGGKMEDWDADIVQTALREANEEVGVLNEDVEVLGALSDVYIPVSNFLVSPVVGHIDYHPKFVAQPSEVDQIIEMELNQLRSFDRLMVKKVTLSTGIKIEVPAFEYDGHTIWGATAIMLNELRWVLKEI